MANDISYIQDFPLEHLGRISTPTPKYRISKEATKRLLGISPLALAACGGESIESAGGDNSTSYPIWPYPTTVSDLNDVSGGFSFGPFNYGNIIEGAVLGIDTDLVDLIKGSGTASITWFKDGNIVSNDEGYVYTLEQSDVGSTISAEVIYYDLDGRIVNLYYHQSSVILNLNDAPQGELVLLGEMTSGNTLSVDVTAINDEDGLGSFSFQWSRGNLEIEGANAQSYTLTDFDVGSKISVKLSYVDGYGASETISVSSTTEVSTTAPSVAVPFEQISPVVSSVVGETNWGDTWYTGSSSFAVDQDTLTRWTFEGLGRITFDLGKEYNIASVSVYFNGAVSNGNYVNLYVDDHLVAAGVQPASSKTWDIEDTVGRYITYETVAEPHNEYLQVATWSEIAEFTVLAQEILV